MACTGWPAVYLFLCRLQDAKQSEYPAVQVACPPLLRIGGGRVVRVMSDSGGGRPQDGLYQCVLKDEEGKAWFAVFIPRSTERHPSGAVAVWLYSTLPYSMYACMYA